MTFYVDKNVTQVIVHVFINFFSKILCGKLKAA